VVDGGHDLGGGVSDRAALAAGLAAQALEGLPLAEAAAGGQGAVGPLDHRPGVQRPLELVGQLTPGDHGRTAAKEHRHYPGRGIRSAQRRWSGHATGSGSIVPRRRACST
jgi:hypothetical protein